MYLIFSFTMLMVGGLLALLLRAELYSPGIQLFQPELFNQFTTMHGVIMVFGAIMPKIRYIVPMSLWFVENSQRRRPVGA